MTALARSDLADERLPLPTRGRSRRPIAACFGGGGAFGIAFDMGVVAGLLDGRIPVDRGPMLGTSAGAWTAASLAAGITHDELVETSIGSAPTRRPVAVIDLTRAVYGDRRDSRVSAMVIELPTGVRRTLSGADHSLAELVAASSSPPRLAAPHRVEGRRCIDAGITRSTSVDRAKPARVLVVVAPIAGGVLGRFGRISEQVTRYEMQRWRLRTGGDVLYVRPTRRIEALVAGRGFAGLLDVDVARRAYEPSYELGRRCAERFYARHPGATEAMSAALARGQQSRGVPS
jgi:predicted acylesterase/phospholipase RssA